MAEDWLQVHESRADFLSNKLRLSEISILILFLFYRKISRNQLEIVVKPNHGLHPNKYFEILYLTFWERRLVTRHFSIHSNPWGVDEIKDLLIAIEFCNRNTELLLLFSIISPCFNVIRRCFGKLCEPLQYLFNFSFEKSIFPDDLKIAEVFKIFKHQYLNLVTIQKSVTIDQYLYPLVSPKYLSGLCTIAYTNTYLIQTLSIKNSLASRKDTQPTMLFYNL